MPQQTLHVWHHDPPQMQNETITKITTITTILTLDKFRTKYEHIPNS